MVRSVKSVSRLFILAVLILSALAQAALCVDEESLVRCEIQVLWEHPDGWLILAKPGSQIAQTFTVRVYVSYPGTVELEVTAGGERIYFIRDIVEWKLEKTISTGKSGVSIVVRARLKTRLGDYETVWSGTLVKQPQPRPPSLEGWLSPRQWQRMVSELRWETILFGVIFAAVGVGISIICKYWFKLLSPFNMIHMFTLGTLFGGCISLSSDYGVGYAIIAIVADLLAYHYMKGPDIIGILHIEEEIRNINDVDLPIYEVEGLGLCVALQSSYWALKRTLLGQHVQLEVYGPLATTWTRNRGETSLIIANDANLMEVAEELAGEEEEAGGPLEMLRRKIRKRYVLRVDPAAVHAINDLTYLTEARIYKKLSQALDEAHSRIVELEATLEKRALERGREYARRMYDSVMEIVFKTPGGGEAGEQQ